ncbi:MAG: amidohydrolase family protein [Gemmatimonadota bacterium]|nr:amidohydrolase family protein [Gemmatimonadota bacterium]
MHRNAPSPLWFLILALLPTKGLLGQETPADDQTEEPKNEALPLEAARSFRLDTDEGSWLSVDVSPDGRTIVFDMLGDLFTVPIEGGTATRITSGLAFDMQPRYSPDGSELVFISDRSGGENIWTLELATGDTTQITRGNGTSWMSPEWAPDGEYIAASRGETRLGGVKLWMGHRDGGSGTVLTEEPENLKTVGASFSPDGRYIWHARRNNSWDYNAAFPQYQLSMYDRETGETFSRTSRYGSAFRPTLSPDGRWLVYGSRHEDRTGLRIRDLETGDEEWLAYPVQRDDKESIADRDVLPGMSFTPDSREVVASYDGKIWRIPVDGGDPVEVPFRVNEDFVMGPEVWFDYPIEDTPTFTVRQIRDAVPSPDGSAIAFTSLDRLYVMEWPGGTPRRLTGASTTEAHPAWSRDGQWVAWVSWEPSGGHIWKMRADGSGDPVRLTSAVATYQQPSWSPDGTRIAAIRGPARAYQESTGPGAPGASEDIVWVASSPSAGGGPATTVAPAQGRSSPHFTQDSERIYLSHRGDGLVSIRWDGTDPKEHVKVVGSRRPGARQPNSAALTMMAPRGDMALAQVNRDVYVVTVPRVGGEAPEISVANPDNAPFPARRITEIGGEFPAWGGDGRTVHFSMGNAHFVYDLDRARAVEDSIADAKAAAEAEAGDEEAAGAEEDEDEEEETGYEPVERRILIEAARDMPEGTVLLRGGRVITMNDDEVIENADILVRNNRIAGVGPTGSLDVPTGTDEIDISGTTVTPGFVDTHAHMWPAFGLHKQQVWMYLANLAYGVTTTRDPQTSQTDVITYGDLVDAGEAIGPRVYSTGPGVFGDYQMEAIEDADHARRLLRAYSEYYDTKTIKMYMAGNRQQRQWVIDAAREQGLMPTTEGGLRAAYDLTLALDGYSGLEHSYPIYPMYEDVVRLFVESRIAYTPTLLVAYGGPWTENYWYSKQPPHDDPKLQRFTPHSELDAKTRRRNAGWFMDEEYVHEEIADGARKVLEAGGYVGVGSHGQLQGLGYHWELWSVQSGGMTERDALRAATVLGAEALGLGGDLGKVENGLLADLVIMEENPLDDIQNTNTIRFVMKNGRLYDGDTLDEVWPRQRSLATDEMQGDDPAGAGAGAVSAEGGSTATSPTGSGR